MPAKFIILILAFIILTTYSTAQEKPGGNESNNKTGNNYSEVILPVNLFDTFTFSKSSSPYIRNSVLIAGPSILILYGFGTWGWNAGESFTLRPQTPLGPHANSGASDKCGHLWSNFIGKRAFTFFFRATGSPPMRANIEGAVLMEVASLGVETGDGFSPDYGFDPYDFLFNQFGILLGFILDWSPVLDGIFTMKWEYYPTKKMRRNFDIIDNHDLPTDYSGSKWIFTTKLGGIPYLSITPLRYLNIDLGYYTRGYHASEDYPSRSRSVYIGLSLNYTIAFGDLLPAGYPSSSIQTFFNYYHPKWDSEVYDKTLSDRPHDEFD